MIIRYPQKNLLWFVQKLQRLIYKIENSGDTNIHKNGELRFIKDALNNFTDTLVFFDIGANLGDYSELVLEHAKTTNVHLHLFEPQASCHRELENKFKLDKRLRINHFGLSSETGTHTIYKNTDQSGLASLYQRDLKYYEIEMNITENVNLKRPADYIKEHKIERINLIKIDVEGHEVEVLEGFDDFLSPNNIDIIQFEYGGANLDSRTSLLDLFNIFQKKGFVMCKVMRHSLQKVDNYDPRYENFVYQNWVAINPKFLNN